MDDKLSAQIEAAKREIATSTDPMQNTATIPAVPPMPLVIPSAPVASLVAPQRTPQAVFTPADILLPATPKVVSKWPFRLALSGLVIVLVVAAVGSIIYYPSHQQREYARNAWPIIAKLDTESAVVRNEAFNPLFQTTDDIIARKFQVESTAMLQDLQKTSLSLKDDLKKLKPVGKAKVVHGDILTLLDKSISLSQSNAADIAERKQLVEASRQMNDSITSFEDYASTSGTTAASLAQRARNVQVEAGSAYAAMASLKPSDDQKDYYAIQLKFVADLRNYFGIFAADLAKNDVAAYRKDFKALGDVSKTYRSNLDFAIEQYYIVSQLAKEYKKFKGDISATEDELKALQ